MYNISCGEIDIPLCFVESLSWAKTARTIQHIGGYITARGYEPSEISLRVVVEPARCALYGIHYDDAIRMIDNVKTNRTSIAGVFRIAGYAIYPELEYALTNINKTFALDEIGAIYAIECDLVFSGVKAVKEVVRNRALEVDAISDLPKVVLSVHGKELEIKDTYQITSLVSQPDSVSIEILIGSDMDLISRDGYLSKLTSGGSVIVSYPQGETKYYIIDADLVDERLRLTGSIFASISEKMLRKTYIDTTLSSILSDICNIIGIECECKVDGAISYYKAFGAPLDCIRDLQRSAGFIISYRQGKVTFVDVPEKVVGLYDLEYIEIDQDNTKEKLSGLYWFDGIHADQAGDVDQNSQKIYSCFESSDKWAQKCFNFSVYERNLLEAISNIDEKIDAHSAILIQSNDILVNGLVEWFEINWLENVARYEVHYVG